MNKVPLHKLAAAEKRKWANIPFRVHMLVAQEALRSLTTTIEIWGHSGYYLMPWLRNKVSIHHQDGSCLILNHAVAVKFHNNWVFVFTEHNGEYLFSTGDVDSWTSESMYKKGKQ